jgi:REP element-mobilizing transposase RayT
MRTESAKYDHKVGDFAEQKQKPKIMEENGYKIKDQAKAHFITATVVDWVDVFSRKRYKDIVIESLDFCIKNKGMILYGFVIMTNHIHLVVQSKDEKLSDLIRDFKKFTARNILDAIENEPESRKDWMLKRFEFACKSHSRNEKYQFWKYGNHPEEVYSEKFLWQKLDYIHLNPVRAGIVEKASHYIYSSASNYVNGKGLLDIQLADNPIIDVLKPSSISNSMIW